MSSHKEQFAHSLNRLKVAIDTAQQEIPQDHPQLTRCAEDLAKRLIVVADLGALAIRPLHYESEQERRGTGIALANAAPGVIPASQLRRPAFWYPLRADEWYRQHAFLLPMEGAVVRVRAQDSPGAAGESSYSPRQLGFDIDRYTIDPSHDPRSPERPRLVGSNVVGYHHDVELEHRLYIRGLDLRDPDNLTQGHRVLILAFREAHLGFVAALGSLG